MTAALVRMGVVTVCCGDHRPAAGCLCCLECPAGAATANPELLALLARGERDRAAALRMTSRRAFHLVTVAALDDHLSDLVAATRAAVRVVVEPLPHFEGSLT